MTNLMNAADADLDIDFNPNDIEFNSSRIEGGMDSGPPVPPAPPKPPAPRDPATMSLAEQLQAQREAMQKNEGTRPERKPEPPKTKSGEVDMSRMTL